MIGLAVGNSEARFADFEATLQTGRRSPERDSAGVGAADALASRLFLTIDQGTDYRVPSQAGPGNNVGSPGSQKAPTQGPASLVAFRG
jgi:hypothetical protein